MLALSNNPSLAEARARVAAARGNWLQVGLYPNTVMGYSGQQLASGGQAEQQGLLLEQEFIRGGKLRLNRAIADASVAKAERRFATQEQRVLTDVRLGYYEVLIAQARIDVSNRLVGIAREAVKSADALFKAQEVSKVDVVRARVELQTAELNLTNARSIYTAAWSRLLPVLGIPDLPPAPLEGDVREVMVEVDPQLAEQRLLAQSPELAAAYAETERAQRAFARANAEPIPNVTVQGIVQHDNSLNSTNANLQLTLPIPLLNRNQGGIRQASGEVVAARRALDRIRLELQRRFATVYREYTVARTQVDAYSRPNGILANANESLNLISQAYQAGEVAYLDLLNAQRTVSQTNLAYVESLGNLWTNYVEIEGLLLKDSLQAAPNEE